jgi:hypothetical protein
VAGIVLFISANIGMLWLLSTMDKPPAWTQANVVSPSGVTGNTGNQTDYSVVAAGGEIFAIGGNITQQNISVTGSSSSHTKTAMVRAYDPVTGLWRDCAPLPDPRLGGAAASTGDAIYLFGGADAAGLRTTSVMRYDLATDRWEVLPDAMPQPMQDHTAAVANGVFYVMGRGPYDSFTVYCQPPGQAWTELGFEDQDLFMAEECRGTVQGGKLWLTGVMDATRDTMWVVPYALPDSRAIAALSGPLPVGMVRSLPQGRKSYGALWCAGELYLMGGHTPEQPGGNRQQSLTSVDAINPGRPGWRQAAALPNHKCWSDPYEAPVALGNLIYYGNGNAFVAYTP